MKSQQEEILKLDLIVFSSMKDQTGRDRSGNKSKGPDMVMSGRSVGDVTVSRALNPQKLSHNRFGNIIL